MVDDQVNIHELVDDLVNIHELVDDLVNINELVDDQVNIHKLVDDQVNANCVSFCLTLWSVDCLVLAFIHGGFALEYSLSHKTAYVGLHIQLYI